MLDRDCSFCKKYEHYGPTHKNAWKPITTGEGLIPRSENSKPPCDQCPKRFEWNEENKLLYAKYKLFGPDKTDIEYLGSCLILMNEEEKIRIYQQSKETAKIISQIFGDR